MYKVKSEWPLNMVRNMAYGSRASVDTGIDMDTGVGVGAGMSVEAEICEDTGRGVDMEISVDAEVSLSVKMVANEAYGSNLSINEQGVGTLPALLDGDINHEGGLVWTGEGEFCWSGGKKRCSFKMKMLLVISYVRYSCC